MRCCQSGICEPAGESGLVRCATESLDLLPHAFDRVAALVTDGSM